MVRARRCGWTLEHVFTPQQCIKPQTFGHRLPLADEREEPLVGLMRLWGTTWPPPYLRTHALGGQSPVWGWSLNVNRE